MPACLRHIFGEATQAKLSGILEEDQRRSPIRREPVEEAIAAISRGELLVVVDNMDRENKGDFISVADLSTSEKMADTTIRVQI